MTLSILLGTFNRFAHLQRCLEACRTSYSGDKEFIVCDGGSSDGSREWLAAQPDVVLIGERRLEGAVKAINRCYGFARGAYVAILNDDIAPEGPALDAAVRKLESDATIGQIACPFRTVGEARPHHVEYVNGLIYANIAVMRRELLDEITKIQGGVWAPCYRTYGGDTELSCWVHRLGYTVVEESGARFTDWMPQDTLRAENHRDQRGVNDNRLFWSRWPKPEMLQPFGPTPEVTGAERSALVQYEDRRRQERGRTA